MKKILKKLCVFIVMIILVSSTVFATDNSINDNNNNVVISEEEYKNLLESIETLQGQVEKYSSDIENIEKLKEQVEELEELKASEINNNLFEYYEKSQDIDNKNISIIFGSMSVAVAILGIGVAVLLVINFNSSKKSIKESKEATKNAEAKVKEVDTKLREYDNLKEIIDMYSKKAIIDTTQDDYMKIKSYDKIIKLLENKNINDCTIYFQVAEARRNFYKGHIKSFTSKDDFTIKLNCFFYHDTLNDVNNTQDLRQNLREAIKNYNYFIENDKSDFSDLNILAIIRKIECILYLKDTSIDNIVKELEILSNVEVNIEEIGNTLASYIFFNMDHAREIIYSVLLGKKIYTFLIEKIYKEINRILNIYFYQTIANIKNDNEIDDLFKKLISDLCKIEILLEICKEHFVEFKENVDMIEEVINTLSTYIETDDNGRTKNIGLNVNVLSIAFTKTGLIELDKQMLFEYKKRLNEVVSKLKNIKELICK